MRISDWSSDVCSSDLVDQHPHLFALAHDGGQHCIELADLSLELVTVRLEHEVVLGLGEAGEVAEGLEGELAVVGQHLGRAREVHQELVDALGRSEEHTSELQSLMRISYAVFCLKKKTKHNTLTQTH